MGCKKLEDLEDLSEPQVEDKIIPAITQLDTPLVMGSRLKKLIKAIREAAEVSWERKRKITAEDEDVPLPSEELRRVEVSPFQQAQAALLTDEDARETVVSRLKTARQALHQVREHPENEDQKGRTDGAGASAQSLVTKPSGRA